MQLTFPSLHVQNLEASTDFYINKLGFEIGEFNPQACVFKYNQGQASFAIRTPPEQIEGKELGVGVAIWFAVDEDADGLRAKFIGRGMASVGPIIATPFGRAVHAKDLDSYKLTFLETIEKSATERAVSRN